MLTFLCNIVLFLSCVPLFRSVYANLYDVYSYLLVYMLFLSCVLFPCFVVYMLICMMYMVTFSCMCCLFRVYTTTSVSVLFCPTLFGGRRWPWAVPERNEVYVADPGSWGRC